MRVLVCGGRNYSDREQLFRVLDDLHGNAPLSVLIHGAAAGADTLAGNWAESRGVPMLPFPADWHRHGRAAGPIRNMQMLDDGIPDLVVAFPGGRGTANMLKQARQAGVQVIEIAGALAADLRVDKSYPEKTSK